MGTVNRDEQAGFDAWCDDYEARVNRSIAFSGQAHDFFMTAKARHLTRLATLHFGATSGLRVLDFGCGVGLLDEYLCYEFGMLVGLDVSETAVVKAADRNRDARYAVCDGASIPFGDGVFDLVFAVCVLHHVPAADRRGLAEEMCRVTRAEGLVVILEHNPLNPLTRLAVVRCEFDKDAQLLPAGQTTSLLKAAGLGPTWRRYILFFPFRANIFSALERALAWLPVGAQYSAAGLKPPSDESA